MQPVLYDFRYVSVDYLVAPDKPTYRHMAVGEKFQTAAYNFLKSFWYKRHNLDLPPQEIAELLESYRNTYLQPERAPVREKLRTLAEARRPGQPLSIIELGGANGTLLGYLQTIQDLTDVRYVGVEPYKVFTDDFIKHFPGQTVIQGNAEGFPAIDFSRHVEPPVTAAFFGLVLCMVPPEIARQCLAKAAEMTDWITGFDYCLNAGGEIDCRDGETVMFEYNPRVGQIYFAHRFENYFNELGFRFEMGESVILPTGSNRHEYRVFDARRAAGKSRRPRAGAGDGVHPRKRSRKRK